MCNTCNGGAPLICEVCGKQIEEHSGYTTVQYGICSDNCLSTAMRQDANEIRLEQGETCIEDDEWICEVCGDSYLEHQVGSYDHLYKGPLQ